VRYAESRRRAVWLLRDRRIFLQWRRWIRSGWRSSITSVV